MVTKTRNPTADRATGGTIAYSSGTTGYNLVNDYPDTTPTGYVVLGTTANSFITFNFTAFDVPVGATGISVILYSTIYEPSNGTNSASHRLVVATTNRDASVSQPTTTLGTRTNTWATNPNTSAAWTVAEVNGTDGTNPINGFGIIGPDSNPVWRLASIRLSVTFTTPFIGPGALSSGSATVSGTAVHTNAALVATGSPSATTNDTIVGVASHIGKPASSGAMSAITNDTLSGVATRQGFRTATGAMYSSASILSGVATRTSVKTAIGSLSAGSASSSGTGEIPGKIYYVIGPSSGWGIPPSPAEIKAGQISGGRASTASGYETSPTITTDPFDFTTSASGLTPGVVYRIAFVWSDGTNDSNVVVSFDWQTPFNLVCVGVLIGSTATLSGAADHIEKHTGTSVLLSGAAVLDGIGLLTPGGGGPNLATGELFSDSATLTGVAKRGLNGIGALPSSSSVLAATATHIGKHTSTGVLSDTSSALTGEAKRGLKGRGDAGDLVSKSSVLLGTASHIGKHSGVGAIVDTSATLTGAAKRGLKATGALSDTSSTLTAAASHIEKHTGIGILYAGSATINSSATKVSAGAVTGDLRDGSAVLTGTASHIEKHYGVGVLLDGSATISGVATRITIHTGVGSLLAGNALLNAIGTHKEFHTATGYLQDGSATISGVVNRELKASGSLAAGSATLSGDGTTLSRGYLEATGSLSAQAASVVASAVHIGVFVGVGNLVAGQARIIGAAVGPPSRARPQIDGGRNKKVGKNDDADFLELALLGVNYIASNRWVL